MNKRTKTQIVGEYNARIILIDEFIKAVDILKNSDIVKSYNGKKITKRFTDKVQTLLPNYIKIELAPQNWSPFLSIKLYLDREIFGDVNLKKYLTYNDVNCEISQQSANMYEPEDLTYCVNGIREFNFDVFVKCAERKIKLLNNEKVQYMKSLENIDIVIQKTKELETLVKNTISEFPPYIRPMVTFDYIITD